MNYEEKKFYLTALVLCSIGIALTVNSYKKFKQTFQSVSAFKFENKAFGAEGDDESETPEGKHEVCKETAESYEHGALKFFNGQLCLFNVLFPRIAEDFLEKLTERMGLNPDLSSLADDGTATDLESKTFLTKTITGTVQKVVSPDSFAGTYDYVVIIKIDDENHMKMYWSGSGDASKGFLMRTGAGFRSVDELLYIRWDRTTADQSIEILATQIASGTYVSNPARGDRAMFGRATYDTATKEVTVQMTEIGSRRGAQSTSTTPSCWYMYGSGTKDGNIVMNKSHDSCSATGHDLTTTAQDGAVSAASSSCASNGKMDSATLVDSVTTPNGTGNFTSASNDVQLYYSCADLAGATASGKPFENLTVNFDMTKTQADAMFAAN